MWRDNCTIRFVSNLDGLKGGLYQLGQDRASIDNFWIKEIIFRSGDTSNRNRDYF